MLWDIFCRVIDNHGDLGVCWRLSADLASRGQDVRLWVDDASAMRWMAPEAQVDAAGWGRRQLAHGKIDVRPWAAPLTSDDAVSDIWIEAFGCELADHFVTWASAFQKTAHSALPVWVNLEYLSAESYVERSHKLPSHVMSGPLKGRTKWFFYPGFNDKTGGLICEPQVQAQIQASPQISAAPVSALPLKTSLFCYEPAALSEAMQLLSFQSQGHQWQLAHGRGAVAFDQALAQLPAHAKQPAFVKLPPLTQAGFDQLLRTSDLNFVRGEDSLVRALWAGKAFVWHIYPQDDGAHGPKLNAFLDWLQAPPSLRQFHLRWNGLSQDALPEIDLMAWQACTQAARQRLSGQMDLVSQLLQFVTEKR